MTGKDLDEVIDVIHKELYHQLTNYIGLPLKKYQYYTLNDFLSDLDAIAAYKTAWSPLGYGKTLRDVINEHLWYFQDMVLRGVVCMSSEIVEYYLTRLKQK